jgi:glycine hydroxymethyltransferase
VILSNAGEEITKKLQSLVFPGTQGGPLMHVIAAKAVAFLEALQPEFADYQRQVVANARTMAATFMKRDYKIVSGGTDNHLFLLDLIARNVTGKDADAALGAAHITVNKNAVPNDPRPPMISSGLRIGTPAVTTRGFKEPEVERLAHLISDLLDNLAARAHLGSADGKGGVTAEAAVIARVRTEVEQICRRFPVYGGT